MASVLDESFNISISYVYRQEEATGWEEEVPGWDGKTRVRRQERRNIKGNIVARFN